MDTLCLLLQALRVIPEPLEPTLDARASTIVSLEDGSIFTVRPLNADDKPLLAAGFEALSERSRYLRFLSPMPVLSRSQLAYLSELDQVDHVAIGVLDGDSPVAVGRWVRDGDDPESADVAVTVIDGYQGRGVGRMLVKVLAMSARHRGVRWMHFDVLAENTAMLRVLDRFDAVRTDSGPIVHAVLDAETVSYPAGLSTGLLDLLDGATRRAG
jgi:GNAT superfamily N-acetyltransferase